MNQDTTIACIVNIDIIPKTGNTNVFIIVGNNFSGAFIIHDIDSANAKKNMTAINNILIIGIMNTPIASTRIRIIAETADVL